MRTLANSYAVNARAVPEGHEGGRPVGRARGAVGVRPEPCPAAPWPKRRWNDTVLRTDGADIGFVDAHYYPFTFSGATGGANPSDSQVLHALLQIPSLQASIRQGAAQPRSRPPRW